MKVREWGHAARVRFRGEDHVDLGAGLGGLDFDTAAKLSGALFGVEGWARAAASRHCAIHAQHAHHRARLHGSLCTVHGERRVDRWCFEPGEIQEDLFKIEGRDLYLIPTAEYPVTNFVRDSIVKGEELPSSLPATVRVSAREAGL